MPPPTEVNPGRKHMVVVVIRLPEHQHIDGKQIVRSILHPEINIPKFMGKPVDDGAVKSTHRQYH
jgi:hypothetical protein